MSAYNALHARIFSRMTVFICGLMIGVIGLMSNLGYVAGVAHLYQWDPRLHGMAPNTAIALVLTGIALSIIGCSDRVWRYDDQP